MEQTDKNLTLVLGALAGALVGLAAAMILINDAQKKNDKPRLSAGDGVKVGLGVLGVLRLLTDGGK